MRNELAAEGTRLGPRVAASAAGHVLVVFAFFFAPTSAPPALPVAVTVDLVAAVPRKASPPAPAAKPKPAAKPAPAPKPAPPPKPVRKEVVLPKQAPAAKPQPKAKPAPQPTKRPAKIARPTREKVEELEYDDAIDLLRKELGEEKPVDQPESTNEPAEAAPSQGTMQVDPEFMAWYRRTQAHVRQHYITPQEFIDRCAPTKLIVDLAADGRVVGKPQIGASSGDPFCDDNAVRAIEKSSPLPPPLSPGKKTFDFVAEERY